MILLCGIPIFLQALIISIDEFYYHYKRGLPKWERIGHPLDSLSILLCWSFAALKLPSENNIFAFALLCIFSCLFVTKDEFVHARECNGAEHWLHAILFLLHPICFYALFALWRAGEFQNVIIIQIGFIFAFMLYQIVFWQFIKRTQNE